MVARAVYVGAAHALAPGVLGRSSLSMSRTLLALSSTTLGMLPVALTGALIGSLRADLGLRLDTFGLLVASFFIATAIGARLLGGLVDRLGALSGIRIAALLCAGSLLSISMCRSSAWLSAALAVGGIGNGAAHPAANRIISMTISKRRQGLAFGVKQASIPLAGALAGSSLVLFGMALHWRWAFASFGFVVLCIFGATFLVSRAPSPPRDEAAQAPPVCVSMPLITAGAALGAAAAAPLGTFLIDAAASVGLTASQAGWLLTTASLCSVTARVALGWATDRWPPPNQFAVVGGMLLFGGFGFAALAAGWTAAFVAGTLVAYLAGWSWNGMLHHGMVAYDSQNPGRVTGALQAALAIGGAAGPLLFGAVVEHRSYSLGWLLMGALAAGGGATLLQGSGLLSPWWSGTRRS